MSYNKAGVGLKQGIFTPVNTAKYRGTLPITFRSSWELAMMQYLDRNTACTMWGSESIIIPYFDPVTQRTRRYFIDFIATFISTGGASNTFVIEVKPHRETMQPKKTSRKKSTTLLKECETYATNCAKWKAADEWATKHGYKFIIITEKVLFAEKK